MTDKIDVYFVVPPEQVLDNYRMALIPDDDVLPLDVLMNAVLIYQDSEKAIIKYRADSKMIAELKEQSSCEDPLSQEAVDALGFTSSYIGRTLDDVYKKYPELSGYTEQTDEEGNFQQVPTVKDVEIL